MACAWYLFVFVYCFFVNSRLLVVDVHVDASAWCNHRCVRLCVLISSVDYTPASWLACRHFPIFPSLFSLISFSFSQNSVTLSHIVIGKRGVALCVFYFALYACRKCNFSQCSFRFESQCVFQKFCMFCFWIWFWARVRVRLIPFKGFNRQASENKRKKIDRSFIELLFLVKVFERWNYKWFCFCFKYWDSFCFVLFRW